MAHPAPTPEQAGIRDEFSDGKSLTIVAAAGSGKTTSLRMLADAATGRRGLYVAYNKAIATDAANSFPASTLCSTAHSLAYRAYGYRFRRRLNGPRIPAAQAARIMRINQAIQVNGDTLIQPNQLARLALKTVSNFCHSADTRVLPRHVPHVTGCDTDSERQALRDAIHPYAVRAWEDLARLDGQLKFDHDVYLKIWSLSQPQLPYDFILFDEAQDANPAVMAVIQAQRNTQLVAVGDPCQAIYGWRGAIDAMDSFDTQARLHLSKSFRFGPAVAAEANKWLGILGAELRVTGFERLNSQVIDGNLPAPDAVLCRSNAKAVVQVMEALKDGRRVALVGGGGEMLRLAEAAVGLKAGIGTDHPELFAFKTWGEVQDYCVAPETRILGTNLMWERADLVRVGDRLVGFDEEQLPGNLGRRFRTAAVEAVKRITRPCVRITTSDGNTVITSIEHRWLVRSGSNLRWTQASSLRAGTQIMSIGTWKEESTRAAGWLAGMYDGEGYVGGGYRTSRTRHVGVAQTEGPALDRMRYELAARKFEFGDYGRTKDGVRQLTIKGGVSEQLRFLGTVRPERLVAKAERLWDDRRVERTGCVSVVSVEDLGEHDVIAIQTDRRTFIAEGLLSHNCENDPGGSDLKVFVRLIDDHGPDVVIDTLQHLTRDESRADVVISTAHKAKGREWKSVRVANDFREPKPKDDGSQGEIAREDAMLAYVTVTRAKLTLDRSGLAWVDHYLPVPQMAT